MKQDTKRQLLKVDKEASAAREKAYQDYVMQYEMAVAKQQSEAWTFMRSWNIGWLSS